MATRTNVILDWLGKIGSYRPTAQQVLDADKKVAEFLLPRTIDYVKQSLQDVGAGKSQKMTPKEVVATLPGPLGEILFGSQRQKQKMGATGELASFTLPTSTLGPVKGGAMLGAIHGATTPEDLSLADRAKQTAIEGAGGAVIGKAFSLAGQGLSKLTPKISQTMEAKANIPLRSTGRNSFTNDRILDNPLLLGKDWQKKLKELYPSSLADDWVSPASHLDAQTEKFSSQFPDLKDDFAAGFDQAMSVKNKASVVDLFRTPEKVLTKLGMAPQARAIRMAHEAYLDELPKEIAKVTEWSKRASPESNKYIFQWLDGKQVDLAPDDLKVAQEIKDYLAGWADRLHLPKDKRVSDYITHLFPQNAIEKEFDPDVARLIKSKITSSVYDPFLQKRTNKPEYNEDVFAALDAYLKRGVRKANMDPVLKQVAAVAENLDVDSQEYIKKYVGRINMQPEWIDNLIDNAIKQSPIGYKYGQRPVTVVSQKARKMVYRGLLGLNPASALKNLSQGANTYAELGEKYTTIGYAKTVQNLPRMIAGLPTELEKVGVLRDNFIEDRTLSHAKSFMHKLDDGLFYMFNLAEKINRGGAYFGAKSQGLHKGMSEQQAVEYAKGIVRKVQFNFSAVDSPVALSSDIAKTLAQFGSYSLKQIEFLADKAATKNVAGLIRYTAASLLYISTVGKMFGMRLTDVIPMVRTGTPPTLQLPWEAGKAAMNAPDKYGNVSDEQNPLKRIVGSKEVQKGAMSYFPAGGQLRKSITGLQTVARGGSMTPTGKMRYPVQKTDENYLRALFFGEQGLSENREFYDKDLSPLSPGQAAQVQQNPSSYDTILQARKIKSLQAKMKDVQQDKSMSKQKKEDAIIKLQNDIRRALAL